MKTRTKVLLYGLFSSVAFELALYLTFPWATLGRRLEYEAAKAVPGLTVVVGTTGPAFPFGLTLRDVTIHREPATRGDAALDLRVGSVSVAPMWTALLRGKLGAKASAELMLGDVEASVVMLSEGPKVEAVLRTVQLDDQGVLEALSGLKVAGALSGRVEYVPGEKGAVKDVVLDFGIANAQIAGGKLRGFTLPPIDLGTPTFSLHIENGEGKELKLATDSKDINLQGTGTLSPRTPLLASLVKGTLRVRPTDTWLAANPMIKGLLGTAGSFRKPDGAIELPLNGTLARPIALPGF